MSILETIVKAKLNEVAERKFLYPVSLLEKSKYFERACVSLKHCLAEKNTSGIIAEFKRRSPSKGWIQPYADAEAVTLSYMEAGATALSVLTDTHFFAARNSDIFESRDRNHCPILRKDFILDAYQVYESKAMGADVILLIAKLLTPDKINKLTAIAHTLGMEVLLEMQDEHEIWANDGATADLMGINHRNLQDFSVSFENSAYLATLLPANKIKIAESGIRTAADIRLLKQAGFTGFLMGTQFMKHRNPGQACRDLIKSLNDEN